MRTIIQRVKYAKMFIDGEKYSEINKGLLVFLGVHTDDEQNDLDYILKKTIGLRVFEDDEGKMNLSLKDVDGELMIVSQFTLYGDVRRGFRPSFTESAKPDKAEPMYENFVAEARKIINNVQTGVFGADMKIELLNDGPVTIQLDSKKIY